MIDKMTKYSFILLSGDAPGFLKDLEGLGVVDITRSEKPVDDIRAGRFKVPDKKTVAPIGEFSDISSGDDSELPFS